MASKHLRRRSSIESLEQRVMLSAGHVADISTATAGSNPRMITELGGAAFFFADDGVHGLEVWKSDGTAGGSALVKDINPGAAGSIMDSSSLLNMDGVLFFAADDGMSGYELWKSDGTEGGTVMVKDIAPGKPASSPQSLVNVNGRLFFFCGKTLWGSDGTAEGTTAIKDIPISSSASPPRVAVAGNTLLIGSGLALWRSDGTPVGTVQISSKAVGLFYSVSFGDTLLYSVGSELWRTDGTAEGTAMVMDISPTDASMPKYFANVNGAVFFVADDGVHGTELWKTDGTAEGTMLVVDLIPGADGSSPAYLSNINGTLFFSAHTGPNEYGVWMSDGTAEGTVPVKEGVSGGYFTELKGRVVFSGFDAVGRARVFTTDGTEAGTSPIDPGFSMFPALMPGPLVKVGRKLFFNAIDDGHGPELWVTDGTSGGTGMVMDINATARRVRTQEALTNVNGTLFFFGSDPAHGNELWKSDGTSEGTMMVKDLVPGQGHSLPSGFVSIGSTVFFSAIDSSDAGVSYPFNLRLWKSDGTAEGTTLVSAVLGFVRYRIGDLRININGTLFFEADDGVHGGELWKTDGTAEGTVLVKDIYAGATSSDIGELTDVNGTLFFIAKYKGTTYQIWRSDGTEGGTVMLKAWGNSFSGAPSHLINVNGALYFIADGRLWKSDGTDNGTRMVKAVQGIGNDPDAPMVNVNDTLYFVASGHLWKSDGTLAGTVDLKLPYAVNESTLINVNDTLFFQATRSGYVELWKTNGSVAGTVLVKSIVRGNEALSYMTNVDGSLFFAGNDGVHGRELWRSDGTPEGTGIVMDVNSGAGGSSPMALTNVGGALYFLADEKGWGGELWRLGPFATVSEGTLRLSGGLSDDTFTISSNGARMVAAWGRSVTVLDGAVEALALDGGGGSDTLSIIGGSFTMNEDVVGGTPDLRLNVSGAGSVALKASQRLKLLSVTDTGVVRLGPGGKAVFVQGLALGAGAQVDVGVGQLVVRAGLGELNATLAKVWKWIRSGRDGGKWTGWGITSSAAASDAGSLTGLGVAPNEEGEVVVKYGWNGDTNLDGVVNADDYFLIDNGFITQAGGYQNGDLNYDGVVNADDYSLIDGAFLGQGGQACVAYGSWREGRGVGGDEVVVAHEAVSGRKAESASAGLFGERAILA